MTSSIPFSINPDAEDFIRSHISGVSHHAKPVLRRLMYQSDGLKRPRWYYEGESFVIGQINSNQRDQRGFPEFHLCGRQLSVEPDALKHLSGGILGLHKVDSYIGLFNTPSYVLVARSGEAPPRQGMGQDQITNNLSIAGLTFGQFYGHGCCVDRLWDNRYGLEIPGGQTF